MELKAYVRTLLSKWEIVALTLALTYAATLILTFLQAPVYQGRASYIVKLSALVSSDKDLASAVDILSRRTEIATTYSLVANSRSIRQMAADELNLSPEQRADLVVSSELLPGTNVLQITTESHDPVLARDFTNTIGAKTIAYTRDLYRSYRLDPLDAASLPDEPVRPNKLLNLVLGLIVGLGLGSGLAFLAAYLQSPYEQLANFAIFDEQTGVYSRRYFLMRLRQELSRAMRNSHPLTLAMIEIDRQGILREASPQLRHEALRAVSVLLAPHLRDEDILAHYNGTIFVLLLPDTAGEAAKRIIVRLQAIASATPLELERSGMKLDLQACAGVSTYSTVDLDKNTLDPDTVLTHVSRALKRAETATYGYVYLLPDGEKDLGANNSHPVVRGENLTDLQAQTGRAPRGT